jgi:hypothetical protein
MFRSSDGAQHDRGCAAGPNQHAGKLAKTGQMPIDAPAGTARIRATAPSRGIGILTSTTLTLYGIHDTYARSADAAFLDDGTLELPDPPSVERPHGVYDLTINGEVIAVVDDPDVMVVVPARGSAAEYVTITAAQRAEAQASYEEAYGTFLLWQQDAFFHGNGSHGSGTPPGDSASPLLFQQYGNGVPIIKINLDPVDPADVPFADDPVLPLLPSLPPTLTAQPVHGVEGTPIPLELTAAANGGTLSSLVIGNIPVGATLSDGAGHTFTATARNASVDITGWTLSSLTITPTTAANFTLTVTAASTDSGGQTGTASTTETVIVDPLAPTAAAVGVEGVEGASIPLQITASASGDSTLSALVIGSIPVGATLSDDAGHTFTATAGNTSVDIIGWTLSSLTITPMSDTNFTLSVRATATDSEGQTNTASTTEAVTVDPLAPTVTAVAVEGIDGAQIPLRITAWANGDSMLFALVVGDIPVGATLSDGAGHTFTATAENTSVDIIGWTLSSLTITPTTDANFTLTVTAMSADAEGQTNTASTTESVTVEVLDDHWKTASDSNWSSDPHWTLGVPASDMIAVIDANGGNGTSNSYTVTISQPALASALIVNDSLATVRDDASLAVSGALTVTAGTFELHNGSLLADSIFIGSAGTFLVSHGDYTISEPIANYGTIEVADTLQIAGTLSGTGAFKIDSEATLQFAGSDTIAGVLTDNGTVEVVSGKLEIAGTISGTGMFHIDPGATLQLDGADANNVVFAGSTGGLVLGDPSSFSGTIVGLSGSDAIDLTNLGFGASTEVIDVSYSETTNITTLTVTDGTHIDMIQLVGDYTGSNWVLSSDGSGGTFLVDPPATPDADLLASDSGMDAGASIPTHPFERAHQLELTNMLAVPTSEFQQLVHDLTGGFGPPAGTGQIEQLFRDLTSGHNPPLDYGKGEDLHFSHPQHDFAIHA